jgi:Fe-S oxidoreductase
MNKSEELKETVRKKYSEIAEQDKAENQSSCCGAGGTSQKVYNIMTQHHDR